MFIVTYFNFYYQMYMRTIKQKYTGRSLFLLSLILFWIGLISFHTHSFTVEETGTNILEYSDSLDHWLSEEGTCILSITRNSDMVMVLSGIPVIFLQPIENEFAFNALSIPISSDFLNLRSDRAPPYSS